MRSFFYLNDLVGLIDLVALFLFVFLFLHHFPLFFFPSNSQTNWEMSVYLYLAKDKQGKKTKDPNNIQNYHPTGALQHRACFSLQKHPQFKFYASPQGSLFAKIKI